jgi:hypothetical protein
MGHFLLEAFHSYYVPIIRTIPVFILKIDHQIRVTVELDLKFPRRKCCILFQTTVSVTSRWTKFSSPGYPNEFKEGQECSWLFVAPPNQHVQIQFIGEFEIYCKVRHSLCMDYLEIKNSTDFANTGMRYCCYGTPQSAIVSATQDMLVLFRVSFKINPRYKLNFSHSIAEAKASKLKSEQSQEQDISRRGMVGLTALLHAVAVVFGEELEPASQKMLFACPY